MDLDLGAGSGVEATRAIVRAQPSVGVLVVTMLGDDDSLFASVRAGARGYLLKGASPEQVERAVRAVAGGEFLLGAAVAQRAATYLSGARTAGQRRSPSSPAASVRSSTWSPAVTTTRPSRGGWCSATRPCATTSTES